MKLHAILHVGAKPQRSLSPVDGGTLVCIATRQTKIKMKMKMFHLLIGFLALATLSHGQQDQNPPGFISIDCGAPNNYYDTMVNLSYNNDDGFVDSGVNMQISIDVIYTNNIQQSKNMRVFSNGTRNCYTLKPDAGKGHKYLIRASFWYGDYDGKNQTPIFDLHIDVNYWDTVVNSSSNYVHKEIIYTAPRDYVQVCLVNIGLGVPFISALELRLLNDSIYPTDSGSLQIYLRYNLGSTNAYRHPYDEYDRIWSADTVTNPDLSVSNTTNVVTSTSNDDYKVAPIVLTTAEQARNVNDSLTLSWSPRNSSTAWYVYFHFAELEELNGQARNITIYEASKSINTSQNVLLENRKPVTIFPSSPVSGPHINFTISAAAGSTRPPLLNALEVYTALDLPNSPSYLDDANAINDIKKSYGVMKADWQGDPCVPRKYSWSGLSCSNDSSPRIISLNLSASGLSGVIVTSFSNLTAIVSLDLSDNHLDGLVPEFFTQVSNLKNLDLSGNNLSGSIPPALLKKAADGTLNLSLDRNPNLGMISQQTKKNKNRGVVAAIVSVSIVLILLSIAVVFWRIKRKKSRGTNWGNINGRIRVSKNQTFTSLEISKITDNFKMNIGQGGFGKVYFGKLVDGSQVAVKVLSQSSKQGYSEFENEASLLMVLNHKNLVSLIGYCDELGNVALVYEFMPNGNVRQHLLEHSRSALTWNQRMQIAVDAAQGLEYLHYGCKPPIVHRDLKTANILLNEKMQAKIADFGLSKAFASEYDTHITTRPAGTPGYLDPEFHSTGNLNKKSDVYSFGIVLLELVTGKPAIIKSETDITHIVQWVTPRIKCDDIESIIDPRLRGQFDLDSARKLIEIAMSCVSTTAVQRPDMNNVLLDLKECVPIEVIEEGQGVEISTLIKCDPYVSTSIMCDTSEITPR